ncbi:MAG: PAS domain S-box protein, partial [Actinobacteria bacterium]
RTARFRDLVDSVEGIVWEADAETLVFSFVSEQAERILGYPMQRWLREPTFWKDHIHPVDRDRAVRFCQEAVAHKRSHDFEYRMTAADGRVVWLRDLVTVVVDDRPVRLRGVMVDITERKMAEDERQGRRWVLEGLERVNLAIQGTNDLEQMMSDVLDATLSIFDCDRAWLMHPCDPEAVSHEVSMQRTRPEFPSVLGVGDEVPIDPETADMFRALRASSGPLQFGPHSTHPLSSELAQRLRLQSRIVMALYPKGEPPYTFGVSQCSYARLWTPREEFLFQEIGRRLEDALTSLSIFHRLRESEKRYRHIFESTGVSIWEEDFSRVKAAIDELRSCGVRDFRAYFAAHPQFVQDAIAMVKVVDVNTASVKLFAAETKAELLASLGKIFVTETREAFIAELVAIAEGRPFFEAETVLQTLKGDRLTALFTMTLPTSSARFDSVLVTLMDITERKRAEEEQRYHTQLLKTVTDNASSMLYIVEARGRGTYVNPATERITGFRAEELIGHVVHDKIHHTKPDGTPYPVGDCALIAVARTRQTLRGEELFVRKDGTLFPVRYAVSPIFRDGAAVGMVIEAQDLTETKAAEDELRKQAALLSLAHDAIIVRDAQSRIVFWNVGAERTYGWTAAEAIGRMSHELLQTRFPVSQRAIDVALEENGEWEGELTHITRQGTAIVVTSRQSLRRDERGAGATILEINRDVTERRRAEYLTRQVFEGAPDGVAVVGRDYRYRRLNPIYARNWKMPAEKMVGMHVADIVGTEVFDQTIRPHLDRCFAGEHVSAEEWLTNAVGRCYQSVTYSPLRIESERVDAALVISRDLTDHMLAVEALQQAQAQLAHVTRVTTLGELAASIAHEVNQPLAAIVADANASLNWLAAPHPDIEHVREALDAIATEGHRAAEVIQRIRQLAMKGAPRKVPVDLNDVVRDVLPLVRTEVGHHDVAIVLDLATGLPLVLGDRVQLQQVFLNLVMNAIEAMGPVTGRQRSLIIRSEPHENDHVTVSVEDSGVGIAANHLDELFSAFFTTKPAGMGMGLSISRSIVEAHGGRLWATANEPHGAIFHFSLPTTPA